MNQLGRLYGDYLHRPEEAATFSRQVADIFVEMEDLRLEGVTRNNIADTLRQLGRYAEARTEIRRAIDSDAPDSRKRLMQAVLAIFNGSRDPALRQSSGQALADDPALDYDDAAEMLFLLDRVGG